jgi:hypothetical protein
MVCLFLVIGIILGDFLPTPYTLDELVRATMIHSNHFQSQDTCFLSDISFAQSNSAKQYFFYSISKRFIEKIIEPTQDQSEDYLSSCIALFYKFYSSTSGTNAGDHFS